MRPGRADTTNLNQVEGDSDAGQQWPSTALCQAAGSACREWARAGDSALGRQGRPAAQGRLVDPVRVGSVGLPGCFVLHHCLLCLNIVKCLLQLGPLGRCFAPLCEAG